MSISGTLLWFFFFFPLTIIILFYFILKLYNIVLVLPNIKTYCGFDLYFHNG